MMEITVVEEIDPVFEFPIFKFALLLNIIQNIIMVVLQHNHYAQAYISHSNATYYSEQPLKSHNSYPW